MKALLLKNTRNGKAGDIVEVDPARYRFLVDMKLAVPVTARERVEIPEKKTAAKKTTRAKK